LGKKGAARAGLQHPPRLLVGMPKHDNTRASTVRKKAGGRNTSYVGAAARGAGGVGAMKTVKMGEREL